MKTTLTILLSVTLLCSARAQLFTPDSLGGAALGAGLGAAIGYGAGNVGKGAAIGAASGLVLGSIAEAAQWRRAERAMPYSVSYEQPAVTYAAEPPPVAQAPSAPATVYQPAARPMDGANALFGR